MSLQRLIQLVKAERLDVEFQGCDWVGNVKFLEYTGVDDSKLSNPLALGKNVCMSAWEEAGAVRFLPAVAAFEQLLLR